MTYMADLGYTKMLVCQIYGFRSGKINSTKPGQTWQDYK